ncbi:hypothetical protein, partial [Bacillus subtilis]|uniref:hypothetical protein n=1 Tax=Bacillus subtilis TaxID=1423 RepID=UPI001BDBAF37
PIISLIPKHAKITPPNKHQTPSSHPKSTISFIPLIIYPSSILLFFLYQTNTYYNNYIDITLSP